jgi:hypothetical protein
MDGSYMNGMDFRLSSSVDSLLRKTGFTIDEQAR